MCIPKFLPLTEQKINFRCECEPGYRDANFGLTGGRRHQLDCVPVNPCDEEEEEDGDGLCPGLNSLCVPAGPGRHRCECADGFEPDPRAPGGADCKRELSRVFLCSALCSKITVA